MYFCHICMYACKHMYITTLRARTHTHTHTHTHSLTLTYTHTHTQHQRERATSHVSVYGIHVHIHTRTHTHTLTHTLLYMSTDVIVCGPHVVEHVLGTLIPDTRGVAMARGDSRLSAATTVRDSGAHSPGFGSTSSRPSSAYSAFQRTTQLSEVDRVKRAFAKSKLACPLRCWACTCACACICIYIYIHR